MEIQGLCTENPSGLPPTPKPAHWPKPDDPARRRAAVKPQLCIPTHKQLIPHPFRSPRFCRALCPDCLALDIARQAAEFPCWAKAVPILLLREIWNSSGFSLKEKPPFTMSSGATGESELLKYARPPLATSGWRRGTGPLLSGRLERFHNCCTPKSLPSSGFFPMRGPRRQVFVARVEAKATFSSATKGT